MWEKILGRIAELNFSAYLYMFGFYFQYMSKMKSNKKDEIFWKALGENIYTYRKRMNLLQIDLSKKVGLSRTSITNIELGRHKIDTLTLFNISKALNTSILNLIP